MTLIICYDIEDNKIRNKMAKFLEKEGIRLQKSVFAVDIERHSYKKMIQSMQRITGNNGKLAVFHQCNGCLKRAKKFNYKDENFFVF